jgi:hypothetical protein
MTLDRGPSTDGASLRARLPTGLDLADIATRYGPAVAGWIIPFALVVYLALKGGGYEEVVRGEVGIAVSWIVLLGAIVGVLPATRIRVAGKVGLGLLVAFGAWTALGIIWSDSAGRSVSEVGRIAMYASVFVLALSAQGRDGLRRTLSAVATGIAVVGSLALLSRFHPAWFPVDETARAIPNVESRLNYPLNYWNGLAALMAMGIPLLLVIAARARRIPLQALAAAAVSAIALTAYYTFSRGGAVEIGVALIALLVLYPRRLALLPTLVPAAGGAAILIVAARQRSALDDGLGNAAAHSQGNEMIAIVLVVCAGVALIQAAIALAARYEVGPRLWVSWRIAVPALVATVLAAVAIGLALGVPGKLSDDWQTFKDPDVSVGTDSGRFASVSGNGRYQYWESSVDASAGDRLTGIGPGTWGFWWAENASISGYVLNAHSLYFETLAELGVIGLALIAFLVLWVLGTGVTRAFTAVRNQSLFAAGAASAAAFAVAGLVDWVWQLPVIPVAFLLVAGALLAAGTGLEDEQEQTEEDGGALPGLVPRIVLGGLAVISFAAIAIPLAGAETISQSQAQVRAGNLSAALDDARTARDIQPYSAAATVQEALVLELQGDLDGAAAAAETATKQESQNWQNWVVLSRIEGKRGNAPAAISAYRRAKSLNPLSPLFAQ